MNFNEEQTNILNDRSPYQAVVAGAGSGKTRTILGILNQAIQVYGEAPNSILVVTFSRKATSEIQSRLPSSLPEVSIRTFHGFCFWMIRNYHPQFKSKPPQVVRPGTKDQIQKKIFLREKWRVGGIPYKLFSQEGTHFFRSLFPDLVEEAEEVYQSYKIQNQMIDFDDMIQTVLDSLKAKEKWTNPVKERFKRILVDEFQDTNFHDLEWLENMSSESITVVGDDWQSIYGFRGSGPEPFFEFPNRFSGTKVHTLAYNYRSKPNLVRFSKTPILKNKNYYPKEVISARKGKGIWQKWVTDSPDSWEFLEAVQYKVMNENFQILCRSNFRIQEWLKLGIPTRSICTIHASKGLEYDSVFCDLVSGWNHLQEEYLEEERRVLYVALSRAENQLIALGSTEARDQSLGDFLFQELPGRVTRKFLGNVVVKRGRYLF